MLISSNNLMQREFKGMYVRIQVGCCSLNWTWSLVDYEGGRTQLVATYSLSFVRFLFSLAWASLVAPFVSSTWEKQGLYISGGGGGASGPSIMPFPEWKWKRQFVCGHQGNLTHVRTKLACTHPWTLRPWPLTMVCRQAPALFNMTECGAAMWSIVATGGQSWFAKCNIFLKKTFTLIGMDLVKVECVYQTLKFQALFWNQIHCL